MPSTPSEPFTDTNSEEEDSIVSILNVSIGKPPNTAITVDNVAATTSDRGRLRESPLTADPDVIFDPICM